MYPSFQGYMRYVSLLFPLIRPRKVVHHSLDNDNITMIMHYHNVDNDNEAIE